MLKKQKSIKLSFIEEQRLKHIEKIKWKFRAVVSRIIFIFRFSVHNIYQKLEQQNINLHTLEDLEFTKTLLKKQVRTQQEIEFLKKAFENIDFFSKHQEDLSPEIYEKLFQKIGYYRKRRYEILFQYGQRDHQLYIILQGSISVLVPNKSLFDKIQNFEITSWDIKKKTMKQFIVYHHLIRERKTWNSNKKDLEDFQQILNIVFEDFDRAKDMSYGDSFGEMAAINHSHRSATVICKEDCQFITIDGNSFDQILRIQEKYTLKNKLCFLKGISSMNPIHDNRKNDLLHSIRQVKYHLFDMIHREGEAADNLYYIFSGDVELSKKSKQDSLKQNKLFKSDTVRISLCTKCSIFGFDINQSVYQLTAICYTRRCELFVLSREMYNYCVQVDVFTGEGRDQWRVEKINNSNQIAEVLNENRNYCITQSLDQLNDSPNKVELTVQKYNTQILKKNQINNRLLQINKATYTTPRTFLKDQELEQIHHSFKQKIDAIKQGFQFIDSKVHKRITHQKMEKQLKQKTERSIEIIIKQKPKVKSQSNILITQVPNQDQPEEQEIKIRIKRSQSQTKVPYSIVNEFKESIRPLRHSSDESSKNQRSERKCKRILYQPVLRRVNEQKRQQATQLVKDMDSQNSIKQKPSKSSYSGIIIMMQRRQQININEMNSIKMN